MQQRRIDKTRNKKNLNNKTVPFNDPSSPSEIIETSISKLMNEIHQFFVMELNDDEAFSYAYEFIQKYIKIHGINSTNTNIAVKNLFPLFIQQPTTNYIDFYDFLLRKGYGDMSDVQMHLLHDLDRELNLEEKTVSELTQFGHFKAEKQEPKKVSESFIPQITK